MEATTKKEFRKFTDCFKESKTVRPSHLLANDLKKERTDWRNIAAYKIGVYLLLEENYIELRGKAESGDFGYRIEYIEIYEN